MTEERLNRLRANLAKIGRENLNQMIRDLNRKYESCGSSCGFVFTGVSMKNVDADFGTDDAQFAWVA